MKISTFRHADICMAFFRSFTYDNRKILPINKCHPYHPHPNPQRSTECSTNRRDQDEVVNYRHGKSVKLCVCVQEGIGLRGLR